MPNVLNIGAAWLAEQLSIHAAVAVTVRRGSGTGSFSATLGQSLFDSTNGAVATLTRSRDFLVPISDYVIEGVAVEPDRNDLLSAAVAGVLTTHRVLEDVDGRFFRIDDQGTRYRIHTKEI